MAKRLIDAEALKQDAKRDRAICECLADIVDVTLLIDSQPTVDAVEVVRCKDCSRISPSVTAIKDSVYCREFRAYMPCDGYCSYGERK